MSVRVKDVALKFFIGLIAFIVAFAVSYTVADITSAQESDPLMRGFMKDDYSQFIMVAELDGETDRNAQDGFDFLNDPDYIEDELTVQIVKVQDADRTQLRTLGADEMTLYAAIDDEDNASVLIVVARADELVYLMVLMGVGEDADLDGDVFAVVSVDVIQNGLEDADVPDGYDEIELDDDEAIEF